MFTPSISTESAVSLDEVKMHLRIDDDSEDSLLSQYIMVAVQQAEQIMQREIIFRTDDKAICTTADDVPPTVKQYLLCKVGDLFTHRELSDEQNLKTFYEHLLDPYILYDRYEEQ